MIRPSLIAAALLSSPASAATCRLVAPEVVVLDAPCAFEAFDADGSFTITFDAEPVFVTVIVDAPGTAQGYWNGGVPGATHAHDPLGTLRRDGACWVGEGATVCARE